MEPSNGAELVEAPAQTITARRETAGLSKRRLARQLAELRGGPPSYSALETLRRQVNRWESGESQPSQGSAIDLAAVLGGEPDDYRPPVGARQTRVSKLEEELASLRAEVEELRARVETLSRSRPESA